MISVNLCYGDGVYGALQTNSSHFQLYTPQLTEGDLSQGEPRGKLLVELLLHVRRLDIFNDAGL